MVHRHAPIAVVVLFVVLAGCVGPLATTLGSESAAAPPPPSTSTQSPTPTPTRTPSPTQTDTPTQTPTPTPQESEGVGESEGVNVTGGSLPVNATEVYHRVERLMGVDAPAPTVTVEDHDALNLTRSYVSPTRGALGYETEASNWSECGTFYPASSDLENVTITPGNVSAAAVELTLVHEYVHVLQTEVEGFDRVRFQRFYVMQAILEGSAVYVTEAYSREHDVGAEDARPLQVRECLYEKVGDLRRPAAGVYYFGAQHFTQRIDRPDELASVYTNPPRNMEQVINGSTPAVDPTANLSVMVEDNDSWSLSFRAPMGELELRSWLHIGLSPERVAEAANGWGADRIIAYEGPAELALAWVIRMDSTTDADELESAVGDLEPTLEEGDTTIRYERLSNETLVVFAGPSAFVSDASANGTDANVTVTPP